MKINFKIHNLNHIIKNCLGHVEYFVTKLNLKKGELTILNYHGTPEKFLKNFEKQIVFFKKNFEIISAKDLELFYWGKLKSNKPLLLITFDDGIKNNLHALKILNRENIQAFFFIIPNFINTAQKEQKNYFISNIRPQYNPNIEIQDEDFQALNWDELKNMLSKGHIIGSHTLTHTLIANKSPLENSKSEIEQSKIVIENTLQSTVTSFCSINNTLESVSNKEAELIKKHYQYHFTTIPGRNYSTSNTLYIKRVNIESHWLLGAVKYAIGNWDLKRWKNANESYLKILNKI